MNKQLTKRGPTDADEAFIYSTWLRGLYYGNDWFRKINKPDFFAKYRLVIDHLLRSSNVDIICLNDSPDVIVGYSVYCGEKLHWIYVKKSWRKLGIGKGLMPKGITCVTHLTKRAAKTKRAQALKFDPLIT